MIRNTKKILIISEKEEVYYLRDSEKSALHGKCPKCRSEVELLAFNSAVTISGLGGPTLLKLLVDNEVHYIETLNRQLLICGKSLDALRENPH